MAKKKTDEELTSWGDKPGKPLASSRVTRRNLPKLAAKAVLGVAVISASRTDGTDVTLDTKNPR